MRAVLLALLVLSACKSKKEAPSQPPNGSGSGSAAAVPGKQAYDQVARPDFNRWAVRLNLPIYWIDDKDTDRAVDPDEVASLLFYPTTDVSLDEAYQQILAASKAPPPDESTDEGKRRKLVGLDLDQGRATLVLSDLSALSDDDKIFARHMMKVGTIADEIYELQKGATALAEKLPADPESRSLFRRNRGPECVGPKTEKEKLCSAIPGSPRPIFDIYPAEIQKDPKFCETLEKRPDAKKLLGDHFSAVRAQGEALGIVPFTDAYKEQFTAISNELAAAADAIKDPSETALVAYLRAAAKSFQTNDWIPADEAWAKMNVENSKWYVRIAPDEVYWEPCAAKAGIHLTFARINQASKEWQAKLVPVQQEMEAAVAQRAGAPYKARKVTFHLPDFIDIVVNTGDDRDPLGATIGQSLPNWGPVANEGRGRTVAMTNLYTDRDSMQARREQAESLFDAASMKLYVTSPEPGLLNTILHEATHNLGPSHDYEVKGKKAGEVFSGPIASMMEELKAQTGALLFVEFLRDKKIISDAQATATYIDGIVWAFGHTSQGMYAGGGERKTYSNLAAIQIGILIEKGVLTWDANAKAANGTDTGAFTLHADKMVAVVDDMMKLAAGIKARGDRAGAEALIKKYVDSSEVVPHDTIKERFLRHPKASFVYSVKL